MITREEAITQLELLLEYCESMMTSEYPVWRRDCEALQMLIAALRPVSREQVELYTNRLWQGCPRCSMTNDEAFDAGGAHEFRVLDDSLYYCDSNYGWEGEKIGYCPWCGKPLGKATELKHIEKLEVLLND